MNDESAGFRRPRERVPARRLDRIVREARELPPEGVVPQADRFRVFLQVNVDDDLAKSGFQPGAMAAALDSISGLGALEVAGLMTVGRLAESPEAARPTF